MGLYWTDIAEDQWVTINQELSWALTTFESLLVKLEGGSGGIGYNLIDVFDHAADWPAARKIEEIIRRWNLPLKARIWFKRVPGAEQEMAPFTWAVIAYLDPPPPFEDAADPKACTILALWYLTRRD